MATRSVRFHSGEVDLGVVADHAHFGLDSECNPAGVQELLDFRSPAVVQVAGGELRDLGHIDVQVCDDRRLDTFRHALGRLECLPDSFGGDALHLGFSSVGNCARHARI